MANLLVTFKNLSQPIRWSTIAYISCVFCYNVIGTYYDAKHFLNKYRAGEIITSTSNGTDKIKSEWDAVKYGAKHKSFERLYNSIIWPISTAENIIPAVVLALNPSPVKTDESDKKN